MRSPSLWKNKNKENKTNKKNVSNATPSGSNDIDTAAKMKARGIQMAQVFFSFYNAFPSSDTTTLPPSFSAKVVRSWMSSKPLTCHSCLIPEEREQCKQRFSPRENQDDPCSESRVEQKNVYSMKPGNQDHPPPPQILDSLFLFYYISYSLYNVNEHQILLLLTKGYAMTPY